MGRGPKSGTCGIQIQADLNLMPCGFEPNAGRGLPKPKPDLIQIWDWVHVDPNTVEIMRTQAQLDLDVKPGQLVPEPRRSHIYK